MSGNNTTPGGSAPEEGEFEVTPALRAEIEREADRAVAAFEARGVGPTPAPEGDISEEAFAIMLALRERALTERFGSDNDALIVKIKAKLAADAAAEEAESTNGDK